VAGRIHTGLVRDLTSGCGRHCRLPIAGEACECQQATRQYRSPTLARAIWFAQNFSEGHLREAALAGDAASSAGNNSEPIMDVDDIAAVAETIGDVPRSGTLNSRSACSSVVGENVNRPLSRLSNAAKSAEKPHRATLPAEPFPGTVVQGGVLLNT
jgi:hypothetical protein